MAPVMRAFTFLSVIWEQSDTAAARLWAVVRGPSCDGALDFAADVGPWLLEAAATGVVLEEALGARLVARGASVLARLGSGATRMIVRSRAPKSCCLDNAFAPAPGCEVSSSSRCMEMP